MPGALLLTVLAFALLAAVLFGAGLVAIRRRRWIGSSIGLLAGLLCLALAALAATVSVAVQGYRALTREELAATVTTEPSGPQRIRATFRFPDGSQASFDLAGTAIYVDGHVVKWHPLANILGLHTAYQLDRVAGRYAHLRDEQSKLRTVFPLTPPRTLDISRLAQALPLLKPVVDAEYGSATFVPVRGRAELELRVSTTGLLFRPAPGRAPTEARPAGR
jgi:hypothetical protein